MQSSLLASFYYWEKHSFYATVNSTICTQEVWVRQSKIPSYAIQSAGLIHMYNLIWLNLVVNPQIQMLGVKSYMALYSTACRTAKKKVITVWIWKGILHIISLELKRKNYAFGVSITTSSSFCIFFVSNNIINNIWKMFILF